MIRIKRSQNADSRTATHKVSKSELLENSLQHIRDVEKAMVWLGEQIASRGIDHDMTKVLNIDEFYHDFSSTQDGFQGDFKQMHWFHDLHLQERHHLRDRVPEDVNLFDVLEMVADCTMAGMARSGSVRQEDISPEVLVKAYYNTIELLKQQVVIE